MHLVRKSLSFDKFFTATMHLVKHSWTEIVNAHVLLLKLLPNAIANPVAFKTHTYACTWCEKAYRLTNFSLQL